MLEAQEDRDKAFKASSEMMKAKFCSHQQTEQKEQTEQKPAEEQKS